MAYSPTNWQDYPNLSTAITAARLNNMETGISNAVVGPLSIVNADVNAAAAIAYSKLNLALGIVNADVSASAAIVASKLSGLILASSGTGATANQDLAVSASASTYYTFNTAGGGSLRTVGIPSLGAGARYNIRNGTGSTFTVSHNLAGGTGAKLFLRSLGDLVLANGESIDFIYDGSLWVEQSRDVATGAAQKVTGTTYDLVNSVTEGSMISGAAASSTTGFLIPAGTMGVNGAVRVTLIGDMVNNTGGGVNLTIKCKVANATVYGNLTGLVSGATRSPFQVQFVWANAGATNTNFMTGTLIRGMSAAFASGSAASVAGIHIYDDTHMVNVPFMSGGLNGVDMSLAQYVDITALWGSASLSASIRRMYASVEYL